VFCRNFDKLGHGVDNCFRHYGIHALDGNRFGFQRINDKIKDGSSGCQGVELHPE
jgi:hypothetical protein